MAANLADCSAGWFIDDVGPFFVLVMYLPSNLAEIGTLCLLGACI